MECTDLLKFENWVIHIQHCLREANCAGNYRADEGVDLSSHFTRLHSPPLDLSKIFYENVMSVT